MKHVFTVISTAALMALSSPVHAGGNGQAIGQDDALLAATKCANSGKGNGAEIVVTRRGVTTCRKNLGGKNAEDHPRDIDPGNSGN
ncbi:hypothetical protein [Parasedimentitalea huanghaiensis]|uniref:Uncharacterized protein n=1 Tax=Parasedimentitalea huanghaiensis TaxID=2682100 RepID=A0A6L6WH22_9RHOB|nr:hypothetical protein [Zongyanglinia huanghaiensis]MVO17106.1 hypothetical protein [Zongyanglinia huanghaiensis]